MPPSVGGASLQQGREGKMSGSRAAFVRRGKREGKGREGAERAEYKGEGEERVGPPLATKSCIR